MNPKLNALQPYPFERLNQLKAGLEPPPQLEHIALSIGEPKHAPPGFVVERLSNRDLLQADLATYPATRGSEALREAIAAWVLQRFRTTVDPATEVLPVAGTREALFSFAQAVMTAQPGCVALLPNPFYQIYEGAVLLAGGQPVFVNSEPTDGYQPSYDDIDADVWRRTELVYLCSPNNPTGSVLGANKLQELIRLAHEHDFIIASDECYSEIYLDEASPPVGLLEASEAMGNDGHERCVVFHSLSKRSNLPGLRSGFVAGDRSVLERYFLFRTYEGCALPAQTQAASALAWADEAHVVANRALYRQKFAAMRDLFGDLAPAEDPAGGFYWWLPTPQGDEAFAAQLFQQANVTVLPGSYLSRPTPAGNPGANHVRIAWVAPLDACIEAGQRLLEVLRSSA